MTTTKLVKGLSWSALPETREIIAVSQDTAIEAMREIANDWAAEGEDLAQIEANLPLVLADVCRIVLLLDEDQTARALGFAMYATVRSMEESR